MFDSASQSDEEPGTSIESKRVTNNMSGIIKAQPIHFGFGNNYAEAGNI